MIFATRLWRRSTFLAALAIGTVPGLHAGDASAQTAGPDIYAVTGIEVDVVAESAARARELALEEAQRDGLQQLLERLTSAENYGDLPSSEGISLQRVVRSMEVNNEQVAATRYLADISVVYDETAIQEIMQSAGIPSVLTPSEPILIVPVLQGPNGPVLWDKAGAWRDAWWEEADRNTVLRLVLPLGDLTDVTTLRPAGIDGDAEAMLAAIAERYGAEAAIVARAAPHQNAGGPQALTSLPSGTADAGAGGGVAEPITISVDVPQRWNWPFEMAARDFTSGDPEEPELVWHDGVRSIIEALEQEWKRAHLIRYDQVSSLAADVPISRLEDWIDVRRSLSELPEVRNVSIDAFSVSGAEVTIRHIGDMARLGQGLERRGLELEQVEGKWQLRPLSRELPPLPGSGYQSGPGATLPDEPVSETQDRLEAPTAPEPADPATGN